MSEICLPVGGQKGYIQLVARWPDGVVWCDMASATRDVHHHSHHHFAPSNRNHHPDGIWPTTEILAKYMPAIPYELGVK